MMKTEPEKERTNFFFRLVQNHYRVSTPIKSESQIEREKWLLPGCLPFNRWACMPAAFVIQFCCGSISSWSVLNKPIDLLIYGENRNMAPIAFYLAVGFLGAAAALMGAWLERHGPFVTCALGTTLFFVGNLLTALALHLRLIWLVFIGYGVVAGFGMGVCYISPVSALQKWFPDKKGFASGFAVCGVGAGSIVISKVLLPLIHLVGLPLTFVTLGSIYFTSMMICASVLRTPPPGYTVEPGKTPDPEISGYTAEVEANGSVPAGQDNKSFEMDGLGQNAEGPITPKDGETISLLDAITSKDFRLLMLVFTSTIVFGLMLASRLSNIITDVFGKTPGEASTVVSVNAGLNLLGRLVSVCSDYVGRKNYFLVILSIQLFILGSFSVMTDHRTYIPFILSMWLVTGCYGSAFGSIPALLADKFGAANGGACHGIVLTGWSFAAIAGGLTFTGVFNAVIPLDHIPSDPRPYNVNIWWILGVACMGWVALLFVKPTPQDLRFNSRLRSLLKCGQREQS